MSAFIVVSNNEKTRKLMVDAVESEGMETIATDSLAALPLILREIPICGVLIDIVTSMKATTQEKNETNLLLQIYPCAKVKVLANEIKVFGFKTSLKQFIDSARMTFKPRIVRKRTRKTSHVAVLVSADKDFADVEKAVTLNVSDEGCFVYTAREWRVGDRAWLRFVNNENVIPGVVCWCHPWGIDHKIPGTGIRYV